MSRFTRAAWWVLPIAVALTGSVAVGATVSQTVNRAAASLPEVTVPAKAVAGAAPSAVSKGIVLGGRALVPGSAPGLGEVTTTTTPRGEQEPGDQGVGNQGEGSQAQTGQEPGDETETTVVPVPPPTVVTIPSGDDDDDEDRPGSSHRDHVTTSTAPRGSGSHGEAADGEDG